MDDRQRWHDLQRHLMSARTALAAGDRGNALAELDAALQIDPQFAAALAMRERIAAGDDATGAPAPAPQPEPPRPVVSAESYAMFERRARLRRIEKRAAAARVATAARHFDEAADAIEEIRELDPDSPSLAALDADLKSARDARRRGLLTGPAVAAVLVFAVSLLAAQWLDQQSNLLAYPVWFVTNLVAADQPALVSAASPEDLLSPVNPVNLVSTEAVESHAANAVPAAATTGAFPATQNADPLPSLAVVSPEPRPTSSIPPALPAAREEPIVPVTVPEPPAADVPKPAGDPVNVIDPIKNDDAIVRRVLQQYRSAYDDLDARSAQAVWPAVNERALERAFDELESQHLVFEACDVQVAGDLASATCRGSASYVPKVGGRDMHVEPRVWTFALRRAGATWKIDTARVEQ